MKMVIATRGSALALVQARTVAGLLSAKFPDCEFPLLVVKTKGDKFAEEPFSKIEGKGVFVKEIEESLLRTESRLAVHSMKDLPIDLAPGLRLTATPAREDVRDALISRDTATLEALPSSAVVGTGSPRRKAQLLAFRPDLRIENIRGNLDTRIAKLRGRKASPVRYDAIVVAAAGCLRLGYEREISEYIPPEVILPAAGQGALAIECREDDLETTEMVRTINDPPTFAAARAERALVMYLGGGCHTAIAALATIEKGRLRLRGAVLSAEGGQVLRAESTGSVEGPESVAKAVAEELLRRGAAEIIRRYEDKGP